MDLRQLIDNTRMSGYQWLIIAVAAFVNALDGYDLVAMAFSANAVTEEFDLSGSTLGWLLASALIGVGVGAVALAPLADRFGRKRLRSEEHTSELQSRFDLVCRLLLERTNV